MVKSSIEAGLISASWRTSVRVGPPLLVKAGRLVSFGFFIILNLLPIYTVYVLFSSKFNKIYIGYTSDFKSRFLSHNKLATKGYTVRYRPWEILFTEDFESKSEAMKREKQLKSGKGRECVWSKVQ